MILCLAHGCSDCSFALWHCCYSCWVSYIHPSKPNFASWHKPMLIFTPTCRRHVVATRLFREISVTQPMSADIFRAQSPVKWRVTCRDGLSVTRRIVLTAHERAATTAFNITSRQWDFPLPSVSDPPSSTATPLPAPPPTAPCSYHLREQSGWLSR